MAFIMSNGKNMIKTVFSAGTNVGGTEITYGTVTKEDRQATIIANRLGETIHIGDDSLDALILALQEVQKEIQTGLIKKQGA